MSPASQSASLIGWARKLQAIAQNGLAFSRDPFDRERYSQLQQLATEMLSQALQVPLDQAHAWWRDEVGYATPKVDVRGGVFEGDRVLLVRERSDGRWTLPGGWVDVNDAPSEAVAREIHEESGYEARAVKLAALVDRNRHPHPPAVYHIFKLFFVCELCGGSARAGTETDAVEFFPWHALPELSTGRVLATQIERLYRHRLEPRLPTAFDRQVPPLACPAPPTPTPTPPQRAPGGVPPPPSATMPRAA